MKISEFSTEHLFIVYHVLELAVHLGQNCNVCPIPEWLRTCQLAEFQNWNSLNFTPTPEEMEIPIPTPHPNTLVGDLVLWSKDSEQSFLSSNFIHKERLLTTTLGMERKFFPKWWRTKQGFEMKARPQWGYHSYLASCTRKAKSWRLLRAFNG